MLTGICRILRLAIPTAYVCHARPREEVSAAGCSTDHDSWSCAKERRQWLGSGRVRLDTLRTKAGILAYGVRLRDGGGVCSSADWGPPDGEDMFAQLRQRWMRRMREWNVEHRVLRRVQSRSEMASLSDGEIADLRRDLQSKGVSCGLEVADGPTLALQLVEGLFQVIQDVDVRLVAVLSKRVPTD